MTSCTVDRHGIPLRTAPEPAVATKPLRLRFGIVAPELPPITFALVHTTVGLWPSVIIAGVLGLMILIARASRGYRIGPSIGGLIGVGVSAFFAYQTGTAAGSFLADAYGALIFASVLVLSVIARYPLAGVIWSLIHRRPVDWRSDPSAVRAYTLATLVAVGVYATRFAVGNWLYTERATEWLVAAKLAMGLPLTLLMVAAGVAAGRYADRRAGIIGGRGDR